MRSNEDIAAALDEIAIPDADAETAPGARVSAKDTPAGGTLPDPFHSSATSEFSLFESSRSGETIDRFHSASDQLLQLGRQRLAQAKSDGKGRLVS